MRNLTHPTSPAAPSSTPGRIAAAFAAVALILVVPVLAFAHAVVYPRVSTTGAYERYVLRVPNEKNVPTTKVEIHFPTSVRVTDFTDVPGWKLEVVHDSAQRIVAAIWTGTLPPERFVEFPFIAVNPRTVTKISWPAIQTYSDGQIVEWTGAEGSDTPASVTSIGQADGEPGAASGPTGTVESPGAGRSGGMFSGTFAIAAAALVLSVISLGFAMRKPAK